MAEKRYYWLKLKEDYFNSPKIKKLRKIAGGDTYTIIYLKMQLLSIKNGGVIQFDNIEPTFEEELSLKLDEDVDNVKLTLVYLKEQSLIEVNAENQCLFLEASANIGSESDSAKRVREFRERQNTQKALQCNDCVTQVKQNSISISSNNINNINNNIKDIIDYLNNKLNTNYRVSSKVSQKHIKARLNEGFTFEDFKIVIDKKVDAWQDTEMAIYLRPETLFGAKFESYLNEKPKPKKKDFYEILNEINI